MQKLRNWPGIAASATPLVPGLAYAVSAPVADVCGWTPPTDALPAAGVALTSDTLGLPGDMVPVSLAAAAVATPNGTLVRALPGGFFSPLGTTGISARLLYGEGAQRMALLQAEGAAASTAGGLVVSQGVFAGKITQADDFNVPALSLPAVPAGCFAVDVLWLTGRVEPALVPVPWSVGLGVWPTPLPIASPPATALVTQASGLVAMTGKMTNFILLDEGEVVNMMASADALDQQVSAEFTWHYERTVYSKAGFGFESVRIIREVLAGDEGGSIDVVRTATDLGLVDGELINSIWLNPIQALITTSAECDAELTNIGGSVEINELDAMTFADDVNSSFVGIPGGLHRYMGNFGIYSGLGGAAWGPMTPVLNEVELNIEGGNCAVAFLQMLVAKRAA